MDYNIWKRLVGIVLFLFMDVAPVMGTDLADLQVRLLSPDWEVMTAARVELQLLPADDIRHIIPTLLDALNDPSLSIQNHAAYSLSSIAPYAPNNVPELVQAFTTENRPEFSREQIQETLRHIGMASPDGRRAIWETYQHAAALVQVSMLPLMLETGITDSTMLPALTQAITSVQGERIINALVPNMKRFGSDAEVLVAPLLEAMETCNPEHCPNIMPDGIYALGEIGSAARAARPFLESCMQTQESVLRWHAVIARHKIDPAAPVDFNVVSEAWAGGEERSVCTFNHHSFNIILRDNAYHDSTTAWIVDDAYQPVDLGVYGSIELKTFAPPGQHLSLCDRTLAVPLNDQTILVMLLTNNRPFGDVVSLFAYDPVQHTIVATAPDVGECTSGSTPPTVWNGKMLRFETRAQPSDSVACTENCGTIGKQQIVSISDEPLPQWWKVTFQDGVLATVSDVRTTWESSPLQTFFTTQAEFERAFRYDEAVHDRFGIEWYAVATLANGKTCLFPSPERGAPPDERYWLCP